MTKKDYVRLAAAIKDARADIRGKEAPEHQEELLDGTSYAADFLADALANDNPLFNRARFLAACGVTQ